MNDAEWLATEDTQEMIRALESASWTVSERKSRLFACACCHRVRDEFEGNDFWQLVEVSERYADGQATKSEMEQLARNIVKKDFHVLDGYGASLDTVGYRLYRAAEGYDEEPTYDIVDAWGAAYHCSTYVIEDRYEARMLHPSVPPEQTVELAAQSRLLRDIFGNPFRPVTFSPAWRTDTALSLARQMYDSREFSAMPILADALQDAGCDSEDILNHCRGDGPHVRGCWVVDLVLGKE
jgi:hypothetical protein